MKLPRLIKLPMMS